RSSDLAQAVREPLELTRDVPLGKSRDRRRPIQLVAAPVGLVAALAVTIEISAGGFPAGSGSAGRSEGGRHDEAQGGPQTWGNEIHEMRSLHRSEPPRSGHVRRRLRRRSLHGVRSNAPKV